MGFAPLCVMEGGADIDATELNLLVRWSLPFLLLCSTLQHRFQASGLVLIVDFIPTLPR